MQESGDLVLAGLDSVDAQVVTTWDNRISQPDEATTQARLQTVFELELRKHGIVLSSGANNYLYLSLVLLYDEDGTVSYAHSVHLDEPGIPSRTVTDLLAGVMMVGVDWAAWDSLRASDSVQAVKNLRAGMWDRFWDAYQARRATWLTTWQGPRGVIHVGRLRLRESLERRAVESAQAFANAFIASRPR
jgi:hypothetical protein